MKIKELIYDLKILKYFFYNKDRFIKRLTKTHSKNSFLTYHIRPKQMGNLIDNSLRIKDKISKVGLVMQGPLRLEDHFTYETLKYYKKIYNNCEIILSTWEDENERELKEIEKLGVTIVKNKKPKDKGYENLNYQIVSTYNGIKTAKDKKCEYILKTRTDVRIYECGIEKFLIDLLELFPSRSEKQNKRVITIDINMNQYYLCMSDIFQFGTIEEIEKVWESPLYLGNITMGEVEKKLKGKTFLEEVAFFNAERYLLKNYLEKLDIQYEVSLKKYYEILKNNFIVIDSSMINMFWNKYTRDEYDDRKDYGRKIIDSYINFVDWITIYKNDIEIDESFYTKNREWVREITIADIEGER